MAQRPIDVLPSVSSNPCRETILPEKRAQLSVVPRTLADRRVSNLDLHLQAVNSSHIRIFGLHRSLSWIFVIADVPRIILGSHFLAEFDLLFICRHFQLLDRTTGLSVRGFTPFITLCNLSVTDTDIRCPYRELLLQHPNTNNHQFPSGKFQHDVMLHIRATSPPGFARPRRLAPARPSVAKAAFENMLQVSVIQPSMSPSASSLQMEPKATSRDWWSCGGYRALNNLTIHDRYPVPHLQDFAGSFLVKRFSQRFTWQKKITSHAEGMWMIKSSGDSGPKCRGIVTLTIDNGDEITAINNSSMDRRAIIPSTTIPGKDHEDCQI
ncbi:unnamed protein product [Schistocephalus solidus]|uniref:Uncharacterized protein n=1 Tax=Schistocephalus solidus TaxID=70667 RepID=A0A183TAU0_SCHSO|nr:unnamed protein product [Schistocephalus solidus]